MTDLKDESGKGEIVFLTQDDKELLIYTSSDVWITPELRRFKKDLLRRAGICSINSNPDSR